MTFSLRALTMGALALGLSACASDTTDTPEPLDGATEVAEAPAEIPAGTYNIDQTHTELGFRVRHLGISNVDGVFKDFSGTITVPASGLDGLAVNVTAQVPSIETDNEQRNGHLMGPDFFDAENHPELTFVSTSITPTGGNTFDMTGDLTMRGTTRPVTLSGEYLGSAMSQGTQKIGFQASGELTRQDWGLSWDGTNEVGEAMVGDTVTLMISAEADLQAEEGAEAEGDATDA